MDKIIVMVRTSTSEQDITDQHREMEDFVLSKGWKKNQIIWVEEQGASAAKVDDTYRSMIDTIKEKIESDKDIKCFAVWHLNRLARTEEVWVEVKTFFVSHKVQVLVKNPELKLLTEDGKVDAGMELAAGLLAILSVQDQLERKEKFKRAKKSMAASGKYVGGHIVPFGYSVGEDGFYVEKEDEASAIRIAFQLYSTGKYSTYTLSKELEERGISISEFKLCRMLRNKAYIGEAVGEYKTIFPAIISKELFEEVENVRVNNKIEMKKKGAALGAKLIKCPSCGAVFTSNSKHYRCSRHSHHGPCNNGFALKASIADGLLWRLASTQHIQYLTDLNENRVDEYKKQLEVIEEKMKAGLEKLTIIQGKKDRIADNYVDGLISKKDRDKKLSKVQDEIRTHQEYMASLQEKWSSINGLLEEGNPDSVEAFVAALDTMDNEDKFDIIHKHITRLTPTQVSFGKRDPRTHRPNAVHIVIETTKGSTYNYLYFPKLFNGFNLYEKVGRKWVPDMYLI